MHLKSMIVVNLQLSELINISNAENLDMHIIHTHARTHARTHAHTHTHTHTHIMYMYIECKTNCLFKNTLLLLEPGVNVKDCFSAYVKYQSHFIQAQFVI